MSDNTPLLKDMLFNKETVTLLANCIAGVYPPFSSTHFIDTAIKAFPQLELKERMSYLRELIEKSIDAPYPETLEILKQSLDTLPDATEAFVFGAYQDYIMVNGCTEEHLNLSLNYIGAFTAYFSGEFAIRTFINTYPIETFEYFNKWSLSEDVHRRRLASEGLRPKLPWSIGITFDYTKGIKILDNLYTDEDRYVTRSVANHLNDISKIDPDLVVKTLKQWKASGKQDEKEMTYIINHSLRTLIKKGHAETLEFLGYPTRPNISIQNALIETPTLNLNDYLVFAFDIEAHDALSLMVDYTINYPMAKGKRSDKVFKIKKLSLQEGERVHIDKRHQFKLMTTKKLYSGTYHLSLKINGTQYNIGSFSLLV